MVPESCTVSGTLTISDLGRIHYDNPARTRREDPPTRAAISWRHSEDSRNARAFVFVYFDCTYSPPLSATISTRYGFGAACPGLMTSAFSPPAFSTSVSSTSVSSVLESGVLKIIGGSASSSVLMDSSSSSSTLSTSARFKASCSSRGRFSEGPDNVFELFKPSSALSLIDSAGGGLLDSEEDV
ncbi:unnamed protein product [Ixodes pacificus]